MAEDSGVWVNSGVGDASPHTLAETAKFMGILAGVAGGGVVPDYLNELTPAVNGSNVEVGTGAAVVDGHPYLNDALRSITPTTPSTGTTGRRIVARANWAAQTVRLVEISSADGTATIPSVTQTPGTTYDLPICSYTVTTGGVIGSFLDTRTFSRTPNSVLRHKSATQAFAATTTYADVTAVQGSMAFAIKASEVWHVRFRIPISISGTGGIKLQLTGPTSPTLVSSQAKYGQADTVTAVRGTGVISGFSTTILGLNSTGSPQIVADSVIDLDSLIINGANAGAVTLQAAQNSSNGTTNLLGGTVMRAERLVA